MVELLFIYEVILVNGVVVQTSKYHQIEKQSHRIVCRLEVYCGFQNVYYIPTTQLSYRCTQRLTSKTQFSRRIAATKIPHWLHVRGNPCVWLDVHSTICLISKYKWDILDVWCSSFVYPFVYYKYHPIVQFDFYSCCFYFFYNLSYVLQRYFSGRIFFCKKTYDDHSIMWAIGCNLFTIQWNNTRWGRKK